MHNQENRHIHSSMDIPNVTSSCFANRMGKKKKNLNLIQYISKKSHAYLKLRQLFVEFQLSATFSYDVKFKDFYHKTICCFRIVWLAFRVNITRFKRRGVLYQTNWL